MKKTCKYNRITSLLLSALFIIATLCACGTPTEENTEPTETVPAVKYTVGVIRTDVTDESEKALEGFYRAFAEKDFEQDVTYSASVIDCEGKKANCEAAAEQFTEDEVDLIFAIGEKAAKAAKKATDTIPIIFCSVSDPIESKLLKSCSEPEGNITGVTDYTPVYDQIELIKELVPDAKKISALYNTTDEDSILVSTLASAEAEILEIDYTPYTASTEKQLDTVLSEALNGADALYITDDDFVKENIDTIIKKANKKKVPVFCVSEDLLSEGCLATSLPDYEDLGHNAGELALICLKELHPISSIAVEYPSVCIDYINESVAEKYSIDISAYEDFQIIN